MKLMFALLDRLFAKMARAYRAQARSYDSGFAPRLRMQPIPVRSRRR